MSSYLKKEKELVARIEAIELQQLPRLKNNHANALANVTSNVSMEGKSCSYSGKMKHSVA